jgi:hypothetical protein
MRAGGDRGDRHAHRRRTGLARHRFAGQFVFDLILLAAFGTGECNGHSRSASWRLSPGVLRVIMSMNEETGNEPKTLHQALRRPGWAYLLAANLTSRAAVPYLDNRYFLPVCAVNSVGDCAGRLGKHV